jgi:adenylate cyclase
VFTKFLKYSGLIGLVTLSSLSILLYQFRVEITNSNMPVTVKKFLGYPTFFEDKIYDFRANFVRPSAKEMYDDQVVLAAIDETSLKKIGRFPWARATWAELLKKMKGYGAKIVAFDVIFSEKERYLKKINGRSPDEIFADAIKDFQSIKGNKVIIPYSISHIDEDASLLFKETPDALFDFMLNSNEAGPIGLLKKKITSTTFPIKEILDAKPSLAYIVAEEDPDGVFRHYNLLANADGLYFPSLSLHAYQLMSGDQTTLNVNVNGDGLLKAKTGDLHLNFGGETKLRWTGGLDTYPIIGISKILEPDDKEMEEEIRKILKGKLVFIGSTAFGAHDFRHTPIDAKLPGVFLHMNMVTMLNQARFFKGQDLSLYYSWILLLIGTILMILVSFLHNAVFDTVFVLSFVIVVFFIDYFYFMPRGYQIMVFFPVFTVVGTYSWDMIFDFYVATKDKAFLKNAFGSYISPELIDQMYESGEQPSLGGAEDVLTAYFTDIQGFSSFSEKLTPTRLVELLNEYLTAMTDILLAEGGTLDKYEGDAIIAFFGAPMRFEDHASRACEVALQMQESLLKLRAKWVEEGDKWPEVVKGMRMRIGINSGRMVTGNMGSASRMNYTMMGDSVNLAARLEEAAKQYGIFNQVSMFTEELTDSNFIMRELDTIRVVGKSEPVTTYDLFGRKGSTEENLMQLKKLFEEGLALYKGKEWDSAIAKFKESLECEYKRYPLLKGVKANPSEIYIERCEQFKENPPPGDWDGVYTLTSK